MISITIQKFGTDYHIAGWDFGFKLKVGCNLIKELKKYLYLSDITQDLQIVYNFNSKLLDLINSKYNNCHKI